MSRDDDTKCDLAPKEKINKSLADFERQMNGLAESYRRSGERLRSISGRMDILAQVMKQWSGRS